MLETCSDLDHPHRQRLALTELAEGWSTDIGREPRELLCTLLACAVRGDFFFVEPLDMSDEHRHRIAPYYGGSLRSALFDGQREVPTPVALGSIEHEVMRTQAPGSEQGLDLQAALKLVRTVGAEVRDRPEWSAEAARAEAALGRLQALGRRLTVSRGGVLRWLRLWDALRTSFPPLGTSEAPRQRLKRPRSPRFLGDPWATEPHDWLQHAQPTSADTDIQLREARWRFCDPHLVALFQRADAGRLSDADIVNRPVLDALASLAPGAREQIDVGSHQPWNQPHRAFPQLAAMDLYLLECVRRGRLQVFGTCWSPERQPGRVAIPADVLAEHPIAWTRGTFDFEGRRYVELRVQLESAAGSGAEHAMPRTVKKRRGSVSPWRWDEAADEVASELANREPSTLFAAEISAALQAACQRQNGRRPGSRTAHNYVSWVRDRRCAGETQASRESSERN